MAFSPDDRYDDWQGMYEDLKQRIPFYLSDFYDGFAGEKTLHKTISATIFLYFACILPAIAFGVLNLSNTGIVNYNCLFRKYFLTLSMFSVSQEERLVWWTLSWVRPWAAPFSRCWPASRLSWSWPPPPSPSTSRSSSPWRRWTSFSLDGQMP